MARTRIRDTMMWLVGVLQPYAGSSAPNGWLLCNGATLDSVANPEYADLFTIIGTTYGGTGDDDFDLPDLRDQFLAGAGTTYSLAQTGGSSTVALATANLPSHSHTINHGHSTNQSNREHFAQVSYGYISPSAYGTASWIGTSPSQNHAVSINSHSGSSGSTGSTTAHENKPPFTAVNYIIKY